MRRSADSDGAFDSRDDYRYLQLTLHAYPPLSCK
jgi:hypothetical protein